MEELKRISKLDNGDRVKGKHGAIIQIISNNQGILFVYNEQSRLFETVNLASQKNNFAKLVTQ